MALETGTINVLKVDSGAAEEALDAINCCGRIRARNFGGSWLG